MEKIAFIGTHGVFKTTYCFLMAALLKQRGKNVMVLQEIARRCPLPINKETSREAQLWILFEQMKKEIQLELTKSNYLICDRSVLDNYVYYEYSLGIDEHLRDFVINWTKGYSAIVLVQPGEGLEIIDDGCRDTDKQFQEEIAIRVENLLNCYEIPYFMLSAKKGIEVQREQIDSLLTEFNNKLDLGL